MPSTNNRPKRKDNRRALMRTSRPPKLTKYNPQRKYVRKTTGPSIGGRPKRDIEWPIVERLAAIHCTAAEIAEILVIPMGTLIGRPEFPSIFQRGWSRGKMSLRRKQFRKAMLGNEEKGDTTLLKWLGIQFLGQRDQVSTEHSGPLGGPIAVNTRPDLSRLSVPELEVMQKLLVKASEEVVDAEVVEQ